MTLNWIILHKILLVGFLNTDFELFGLIMVFGNIEDIKVILTEC